eukprot:jgi/Astpho2/3753/Aster-x1170
MPGPPGCKAKPAASKATQKPVPAQKPAQKPAPKQPTVAVRASEQAAAPAKPDTGAAFLKACEEGDVTAVQRQLVSPGIDVNKKDASGSAPLHIAAAGSSPSSAEVAALLLQHGASLDSQNAAGQTPLLVAAAQPAGTEAEAVFTVLLAGCRTAEVADSAGGTVLLALMGHGRIAAAQQLLSKGIPCASTAAAPGTGDTALHLLAGLRLQTDEEVAGQALCQQLLQAGASPDAQNAAGSTPLHVALAAGQCEALTQQLLASMQKPSAKDGAGKTAWQMALELRADRAAALLAAKLKPATSTAELRVMLADCMAEGLDRALTALLGVDKQGLQVPDNVSAEALWEAGMPHAYVGLMARGGETLDRALIGSSLAGFSISAAVSQLNRLPFTYKLQRGSLLQFTLRISCVVMALAATSLLDIIKAMDTEGNTRLHQLAKRVVEADTPAASMLSSVIAVMASAGAPVSKRNKEQDTPLHVAARSEALVALRALLLAGADVTARNSKNRTPGSQAKLSQAVKDELDAAQEQAKLRKQQRGSALYDKKMMEQQTQSALRTGLQLEAPTSWGGHEVAKLPRQDKAALPGLLYYSIRVKLAVGSWVKYTGQLNQIETVPQAAAWHCEPSQDLLGEVSETREMPLRQAELQAAVTGKMAANE